MLIKIIFTIAIGFNLVVSQNLQLVDTIQDDDLFGVFLRQKTPTAEQNTLFESFLKLRFGSRIEALDIILRQLERFDIDRMVFGYRVIFDVMRNENLLYNHYTLYLIQRAMNLLEDDKLHLSDASKWDLTTISEQPPQMLKDFPHDQSMYIRNSMNKDILATGSDFKSGDSRLTFTWTDDCGKDECVWNAELVANRTYFSLTNRKFHELLVEDDKEQVTLMTLDKANLLGTSTRWHLEPIQSNDKKIRLYNIRNMNMRKILCGTDKQMMVAGAADKNRRSIMLQPDTMASKDLCRWRIMGEIEFNEKFGGEEVAE